MRRLFYVLSFLAAAMAAGLSAQAQPRGEWEVLGEQRSRPGVESLVIEAGRRDGRFDAIRIAVSGGNILLLGVDITFGNGDRQRIRVRTPITAGRETEPIELEGGPNGRFIRSVEVRYGSLGFFGRPTVTLLGHPARGRPGRGEARFRDLGPNWELVSTERPSRQRDRDVIQMSRRDGRFDAILIRVKSNDVRFRRVRVVYGNGRAHDLDINREIGAGEESEVLELRGNQGWFIDRIELIYRTAARGRPAEVEIWARKEDRRGGFRPLGPRWDEVGILRASRGGDRDVIELSRRDGRFDAILIRVKRNDVRFRRLRVVYGNGRADDLDVDRVIRQGEESDVLELRGARGRFVERIELVYATRGGGRQALVEVWGRKSLRR